MLSGGPFAARYKGIAMLGQQTWKCQIDMWKISTQRSCSLLGLFEGYQLLLFFIFDIYAEAGCFQLLFVITGVRIFWRFSTMLAAHTPPLDISAMTFISHICFWNVIYYGIHLVLPSILVSTTAHSIPVFRMWMLCPLALAVPEVGAAELRSLGQKWVEATSQKVATSQEVTSSGKMT